MVSLHNISVRLGGRDILRDISFTLPRGGLTALVGPNGSGKSTLLSCINQTTPYRGLIRLGGADSRTLSPRQRASAVAILPQSLPAPHITVKDMVCFGRTPYLGLSGRLGDGDKQAVAQAMADAGVEQLAHRWVDTLSGGERQRAALAMVLAQQAPAVLLDEPTAHLDPAHEAELLRCIARLQRERGISFLVVLHDLTLACRHADHMVVLQQGRLRFAGRTRECLRQQIPEEVFRLRRYTLEDGGTPRIFFEAECPDA